MKNSCDLPDYNYFRDSVDSYRFLVIDKLFLSKLGACIKTLYNDDPCLNAGAFHERPSAQSLSNCSEAVKFH